MTLLPRCRPNRLLDLCGGDRRTRTLKSSKWVGLHFGLTPTKYQSGQTDFSGRISKIGDASVRAVLYEAAHIMLTKPLKGCSELKSWAMKMARRAGMQKAKVALVFGWAPDTRPSPKRSPSPGTMD
jgi:transposase